MNIERARWRFVASTHGVVVDWGGVVCDRHGRHVYRHSAGVRWFYHRATP